MGDTPITLPPATRIASAVKKLAVSSTALNEATDEFSNVTAPLDEVLQKLNLGVDCWVRVQTFSGYHGDDLHHEVGYAKVNGRWGVALRSFEDERDRDEYSNMERWLFNEGPRAMRVAAIAKIPDLLEELVKKADKATRKVKEGTESAREVIAALQTAATEAGITKPKVVKVKLGSGR
jgi:enamine deaminase RidA (YjgF/YER057c/UK114 family)